MTRTIRLAASAQADLIDVLEHSEREFGAAARQRYELLVTRALHDISETPERPGSVARPELGDGIRSWHLRLSRERARTASGIVRRPRHLILYSIIDDATVGVLRLLHDAMELHRYIGDSDNDASSE